MDTGLTQSLASGVYASMFAGAYDKADSALTALEHRATHDLNLSSIMVCC